MFQVNGKLGKKQYNDEAISHSELIEHFKLKPKLEAQKQLVEFAISERFTNQKNGQTIQAASVSIRTEITVRTDEGQVQIRYYEQAPVREISGVKYKNFLPTRLFINGGSIGLDKTKDIEKIVFLMIHPKNSTSPCYEKGEESDFKTVEQLKDAKDSITFRKLELEFTQSVMNENIETVKLRAEGIGLGSLKAMEDDEVRNTVLNTYESRKKSVSKFGLKSEQQEAERFIQSYNAHVSELKGLILSAIDLGVIYGYTEPSNGKYAYQWSNVSKESDLKDKVLLEVSAGNKPIDSLQMFLINNPEIMRLMQPQIILAKAEKNKKK